MRQKVALRCDWTVYECNNNNRTFRHHKIINLKQISSRREWTTILSKHASYTVPGSFYFILNPCFFHSPSLSLTHTSSLCFCKANTAQSERLHTSIQQTLQNKYQRTSFNSKQIAYACLNLFMVDWTIFSRSLYLSCMAWRCSFQVYSHFFSTLCYYRCTERFSITWINIDCCL